MPSELGSGRPVGMSEMQLEDLAVILGSIGGFLVVVVILVSYCYYYTSKRRKHQHQKDMEKAQGGASSNGGNIMIKSGSLGIEEGGDSHESLDIVVKEIPESTRDGRPLSPVQSWGATTLLQEHERRLSIHSAAAEDGLVSHDLDGVPLHAPFPDVTVTDYRPMAAGVGGGLEPPVYLPCQHEEVPCQCVAAAVPAPGPDYTSYAPVWDEPLTGHLLSRARTAAPTPAPQQPHLPQLDRKRRNVTQV